MTQIELTRVSGDFGFEARDSKGHIARMDSSPVTSWSSMTIRCRKLPFDMALAACSRVQSGEAKTTSEVR